MPPARAPFLLALLGPALLLAAANTPARASELALTHLRAPTRAPLLIYERVGSTLLGPTETLLTVHDDGGVWLSRSIRIALDWPPCLARDPDLCEVVPLVVDPEPGIPVLFPPEPAFLRQTHRLVVPLDVVEDLARDLAALGATRLRGGQRPGNVTDTPLTTVTVFRSRRGAASGELVAPVARANSFSYHVPRARTAAIDARIQAFLDWILRFELVASLQPVP